MQTAHVPATSQTATLWFGDAAFTLSLCLRKSVITLSADAYLQVQGGGLNKSWYGDVLCRLLKKIVPVKDANNYGNDDDDDDNNRSSTTAAGAATATTAPTARSVRRPTPSPSSQPIPPPSNAAVTATTGNRHPPAFSPLPAPPATPSSAASWSAISACPPCACPTDMPAMASCTTCCMASCPSTDICQYQRETDSGSWRWLITGGGGGRRRNQSYLEKKKKKREAEEKNKKTAKEDSAVGRKSTEGARHQLKGGNNSEQPIMCESKNETLPPADNNICPRHSSPQAPQLLSKLDRSLYFSKQPTLPTPP